MGFFEDLGGRWGSSGHQTVDPCVRKSIFFSKISYFSRKIAKYGTFSGAAFARHFSRVKFT